MNLKTAGIITGVTGLVAAIEMGAKKIVNNKKRKRIENQQQKDLDDLVKQSRELTELIVKNQQVAEKWTIDLQKNFEETLHMMEELKKENAVEDCEIDPRLYDVTIEAI